MEKAAEDEIMKKAGPNGRAAPAGLSKQEKEFDLVSLPAVLLGKPGLIFDFVTA
jgi:hypothetical protein